MTTHIWQHIPSGEQFVVEIGGCGQVTGASGPLHYSEIAEAKAGNWDADWDVTDAIKTDVESYQDVTDRVG